MAESYPCDTCGGMVDDTGERCHGLPVFRHRNRSQGIQCQRKQSRNDMNKRADEVWARIEANKRARGDARSAEFLINLKSNGRFNMESKADEFIRKRFPREQHEGYKNEWRKRISGNNPEAHMDSQSLKIWKEMNNRTDARRKSSSSKSRGLLGLYPRAIGFG